MSKLALSAFALVFVASVVSAEAPPRQQIANLVAALEKDQSRIVELVKLTGRDFGLRPELWKKWLAQTSDEQMARVIDRQRRGEELDKEWHEYATAVASLSFSFRNGAEEPQKALDDLKRIGKKSREPAAWSGFSRGIGGYRESGDAAKAAKVFGNVFKDVPLSHYAATADELAFLLERMSEEDKAWKEPTDVSKLARKEQFRYFVYHLRNVRAEQMAQPGICHVLGDFPLLKLDSDPNGEVRVVKEKRMNAAIELKRMGKEAIPALIDLLDDRRPIRSIGHWRDFWPERTVLRHQDAAIQILDKLLPVEFYERSSTAAYLSTESPEVRYRLIARLRAWHKDADGKPEPEQLWLAVKMKPGIYPTLALLKKLAKEHKQQGKVLKELHAMYGDMHRVYRPHLAELMAELGDESKVSEVLDMLEKKEFQKFFSDSFPDDSAASLNAEETARRLLKKYGKEKQAPK